MLYFLYTFKDVSIVFNLFRYITFRSAAASITSFLLCLIIGPMIIRGLSYLKATAHQKREHAESIHAFYEHKNNVPTMGGVLIVASVMISIFLWGNWSNRFMWMLSFVMLGYAALGFFDDWTKLKYKNSKGISSKAKLWGQVFISLVLGILFILILNSINFFIFLF
jgi:phospho-N-acetylmuramoyl-pentapeptide-transferase